MGKVADKNQKQPKRVLIGTPALDGRVDAWFCYSLHELGKEGIKNKIDFNVVMLSYESILPMARNEILTTAIQNNFDALIFIDSDIYCDPQSLIQAVQSEKDVACIPAVKKSDQESYDIVLSEIPKKIESWIEADRVSTSCLVLSKKALKALSDNSTTIVFRGKELKNICQYDFIGAAFMGEDIYLCEKLKTLGFKIWVNTNSTCMHIGPKVYKGNFKKILENVHRAE
jgi:hypothetical protein